MIIPVRCFTCGKVIADKYEYYVSKLNEAKRNNTTPTIEYLTAENLESVLLNKSTEASLLDMLSLNKQCCRRHFITHVDI